MPVYCRRSCELVADVDPHPIALNRFDDRVVDIPVVAPALGLEVWRELVLELVYAQVEHLDAANDFER